MIIYGTEPELTGTERLFWKRCRNTINRYNGSYDAKCAALSENGKKGGRPKKPDTPRENLEGRPENQMVFSESNEKQKKQMVFLESKKSQTKTETKAKTNINTPIAPKGAKRTDAEFEVFWSAYPTKVGKQPARKAFDKVEVPVETLVAAIERQKCSSQWSKDGGQYIPNPATWLNQCRWTDELPEAEKPTWNQGTRLLDADEQAATPGPC